MYIGFRDMIKLLHRESAYHNLIHKEPVKGLLTPNRMEYKSNLVSLELAVNRQEWQILDAGVKESQFSLNNYRIPI